MTTTQPSSSLGFLDQYVTRADLARDLGMALRGKPFSELTLVDWAADKKGPPPTKFGKQVVYYIPDVEKWLRDQKKVATA